MKEYLFIYYFNLFQHFNKVKNIRTLMSRLIGDIEVNYNINKIAITYHENAKQVVENDIK